MTPDRRSAIAECLTVLVILAVAFAIAFLVTKALT